MAAAPIHEPGYAHESAPERAASDGAPGPINASDMANGPGRGPEPFAGERAVTRALIGIDKIVGCACGPVVAT